MIGVALAIVGIASTLTAISRWGQGYKIMKARERGVAEPEAAKRAAKEPESKALEAPMPSKHRPVV